MMTKLDVGGLDELVKAEVPAGPEHRLEIGAEVIITWDSAAPIVLPREP